MPPAGLKRGGARNRRDRPSWQLKDHQCLRLIDRSLDAWQAGQPLSRFITLAWGKAGIDAPHAVAATGHFVSKAREWMRGHGHTMPWLWTQEHGERFGQHAHLLLHVPAELEDLFRPMPKRWAKAIAKQGYAKGTVDSQRLAAAYTAAAGPDHYKAQLMGKLHYALKCAPAELEEKLDMLRWRRKPWGQRSYVIGLRASAWQSRNNG